MTLQGIQYHPSPISSSAALQVPPTEGESDSGGKLSKCAAAADAAADAVAGLTFPRAAAAAAAAAAGSGAAETRSDMPRRSSRAANCNGSVASRYPWK
jgi:hypothetical protein